MSENFETKIDKISEDVAYMRGRMDATLPSMQRVLSKHEKAIARLTRSEGTLQTKMSLLGTLGGFLGGSVIDFITKHVRL